MQNPTRGLGQYPNFLTRPASMISNARSAFAGMRDAMVAAGLNPPLEILADGRFHRFSSEGRRGDQAGWYIAHDGDLAFGSFGCWRRGLSQNWSSLGEHTMTMAVRDAYRAKLVEMRRMGETELARCQKAAQVAAMARWERATPSTQHPYMRRKGIQVPGLRVEQGKLLVPLYDAQGLMWSLQAIDDQGEKRFHPEGRVQGCFHLLGTVAGRVIICEGVATGASLFEATGTAVAIACSAGNLGAVAKALRAKHPEAEIIVAADDDAATPGNPGLRSAEEAATAVGGKVAKPVSNGQGLGKGQDFNDLHQEEGLVTVSKCIEDATKCVTAGGVGVGSSKGTVQILNGSELTPRPVSWLWSGWLAMGKLHILAGPPGQGKTSIALSLAAAVTTGGRWPDGTECPIGNVFVWSGEDDPADTLLPRLLAAGANPARCFFVAGTNVDGAMRSFDPASDMAALEEKAREIGGVKLLVIDPVVSAIAGDGNKNNEVRRGLQPLVDLASRLGAAVLGISHFSKGGAGMDPAARVNGSVAFAAVARVVLAASKVKGVDGLERRILARSKSNIGPDEGGFEYQIEQAEPLPGIHASFASWGARVDGTSRELLQDAIEATNKPSSRVVEMLRAQIAGKEWIAAGIASEPLLAMGFSTKQIWAASTKLGVIRQKLDVKGGWYWHLPVPGNPLPPLPRGQDGIKDSNVGAVENDESSESSESSMSRGEESTAAIVT